MFSLLAEVLAPSPREYKTHYKLRRLGQANVRKGKNRKYLFRKGTVAILWVFSLAPEDHQFGHLSAMLISAAIMLSAKSNSTFASVEFSLNI